MLTNECGACLSVASSLGARVNKCMEQIGNEVGLEGNIQRKEHNKVVLEAPFEEMCEGDSTNIRFMQAFPSAQKIPAQSSHKVKPQKPSQKSG